MGKIRSYKIAWNTKSDEGIFMLDTEDGVKQVLVDSAMEAKMLLTKLRHDGNVYFKRDVVHVAAEELEFPEPVSHEYIIPEGVEIITQKISWEIPKKEKREVIEEDVLPVKKKAPSETKSTPPVQEKKVVSPKKTVTTKKRAGSIKKSTTTKKTKDNLKLIEGIGPKIEGLLNAAGISTFLQLQATKVDFIKAILEDAGAQYKMHDPTTWGKQAALAAVGKMEELKKWQDELKGGKTPKK